MTRIKAFFAAWWGWMILAVTGVCLFYFRGWNLNFLLKVTLILACAVLLTMTMDEDTEFVPEEDEME